MKLELKLTEPEAALIYDLVILRHNDGRYYGKQADYRKRLSKVIAKLITAKAVKDRKCLGKKANMSIETTLAIRSWLSGNVSTPMV